MSMPFIIPGFGTRERSITDLMEAVALQKTALAHVLNAEGEKIQAYIIRPNLIPGQILGVNYSVESMINAITRLEMVFQAQLGLLPNLSLIDTSLPDLPITPVTPFQAETQKDTDES
jgi:hypothetical protein